MALPTSETWNLADFSGPAFSTMLELAAGDMSAEPSVSPYFTYNRDATIAYVKSDNGTEAKLAFHVALPSRYTLDVVLRCPGLPNNLGDLATRRVGFTVADDAGRGFTMFLAKTGIAISLIDDYGSVTALPDTSDVTQAVQTEFFTVRIAVDGGLGRAYVFIGPGKTDTPPLRAIVPVEQTPEDLGDLFRIFAKGRTTEPVLVELAQLRLASDLVVANYPPVADPGPDRLTSVGNAVRFDGRRSYDVEGTPVSYLWQCVDVPYGSAYSAEVGAWTHDDGDADGSTSTISAVPADLPAWLAAGDTALARGGVYVVESADLNAGAVTLTQDALPDALDHVSVRFIRQSILLNRQAPQATAVPDIAGLYRFRLIVSDGELESEPAEVLATITPLSTPTGIEPDVSAIWKAIGDEWRLFPGREVFEEAWVGVAQILAGKMLEAWQYHYNTSIRDAQKVLQRKWVAYRTFEPETAPDDAFIAERDHRLVGSQGWRVTDRVYRVDDGTDLLAYGVTRGDLLVLNNGESFTIDRVLTSASDPGPNQRVLLFEPMADDTDVTWTIPSVVRSAEVDYERLGIYPGDLLKLELEAPGQAEAVIADGLIVGQKGNQLAVNFDVDVRNALAAGDTVRVLGVKRRKALVLPDDVVGVPTLQDLIPVAAEPKLWRENVDYILEPFHREIDHAPVPMLQFHDSVFIDPDVEPPDVLWAETTLFDNEKNVENLFGRLVGFMRDDAAAFSSDFDYISGVAGLLYAQQRGPNLFAMSVGAQILFGQPFTEAEGVIEEIQPNYAPLVGRLLVRDVDPNSNALRVYRYKKNPDDTSLTSGLAVNPETDQPWKLGETMPQFAAVGAGINIEDTYTDPRWWRPFVGSGVLYELQKFHTFVCTFDLSVVDLANIALLGQFLTRIKPKYARALLVGQKNPKDDLDIVDVTNMAATIEPFDTFLAQYGFRYDDYKGNGELSHHYDDGVLMADALVDNIVDIIDFAITVGWPGGKLTFPTRWPFEIGAAAVDVDGAQTGTVGATFHITSGMNLAAGTYKTTRVIKPGALPPPY